MNTMLYCFVLQREKGITYTQQRDLGTSVLVQFYIPVRHAYAPYNNYNNIDNIT